MGAVVVGQAPALMVAAVVAALVSMSAPVLVASRAALGLVVSLERSEKGMAPAIGILFVGVVLEVVPLTPCAYVGHPKGTTRSRHAQ